MWQMLPSVGDKNAFAGICTLSEYFPSSCFCMPKSLTGRCRLVSERILLLAMLPAVAVTKDDVASTRSPVHADPESFQLPQQPSVVPSRQGPSPPVDVPWPTAPRITRTAATPMATPQGSPPASATDVAMSRSIRDTLTVDRLSASASLTSPGTVRARVSTHLLFGCQSLNRLEKLPSIADCGRRSCRIAVPVCYRIEFHGVKTCVV